MTRRITKPRRRRRAAGAAGPRRWSANLAAAALCAGVLTGCGDTLQEKPIPHNILESIVVAPFPVYWLGDHFGRLEITEGTRDVSGAFSIQYGDCLQGGQGTCTPPLRVITSPDNSFLPGATTPSQPFSIRGTQALLADRGRTVVIPTDGVVVVIVAEDAAKALAAAQAMVAINRPGSPGQALPARAPDTGFDSMPLPTQVPATVHPLG